MRLDASVWCFQSARCNYSMFPPHCSEVTCQGASTVMFLLMQWDLRGINCYLSQLLSTLWFPWPQRLKVTRWGQCSQRFPHQPRCEFLTFLFVLFLPNIKVPNIVFDEYIVIKVLWNFINVLCDLSFLVNQCLIEIHPYPIIRFGLVTPCSRSNDGIEEPEASPHTHQSMLPAPFVCVCVLHFREVNYIWHTKPPWTCPDQQGVSNYRLITPNPTLTVFL